MSRMISHKPPKDFVLFILSHKRAETVITIDTVKRCGYTGPIVIVIDNEDPQAEMYFDRFGRDNVVQFDKKAMADKTDEGDNFNNRQTITHARNACYEVAKKLGYKYFIQFDDDYTGFQYRVYEEFNGLKAVRSLNAILNAMLKFYKNTPTDTLAMAQGGEYIGGADNKFAVEPTLLRKAMNSFICSTERPVQFVGTMNEDVNTYASKGAKGVLFFTFLRVSLSQLATQSNQGGITETYLKSGTYVKSMYTVMYQPSSVKARLMGSMKNGRIHHKIFWKYTVPKILSEETKNKTLRANPKKANSHGTAQETG